MKAKQCIWIIDDDRRDIELSLSVISRYMPGVRIATFDSGAGLEAEIVRLRENGPGKTRLPGLILTDLKMPVRDGCEIFTLIRSEKCLSLTPVIIFSSSGMDTGYPEILSFRASMPLL